MRIHKEGFGVIAVAFIIWLLLNIGVGLTEELYFRSFTFVVTTYMLIFVMRFFRYPNRKITLNPNAVISPCDGQIVVIEETFEPEYFNDNRLQISVFMSVYNVHINWIPVPGIIKYFQHHSGNFMAAYLPKSSTENERATTVIQMEDGTEVLVRQIAGAVAKRIISYPKVGAEVNQQDQLGFIRFGSRVDIFLPVGTKVDVELCQLVTGSQSILAQL
jgi:phosphatidylserine decarboxylase